MLLVAPLLIENGLTAVVDQLLVVDVDPQLQLQRTVQRDQVSSHQVATIMASQCQRAERLQQADQIISNESDVAALSNKVASLHQLYLAIAAEKLAKSPT